MNFADALRAAKRHAEEEPLGRPFETETFTPAPFQPETIELKETETMDNRATSNEAPEVAPQVQNGTVVRFEMFLTPEQLGALFRAVVANQHAVFTLREAASHMRIAPHVLEDLARTGEVPAFLVDGKWRFPRNGVDEWMQTKASKKEAS